MADPQISQQLQRPQQEPTTDLGVSLVDKPSDGLSMVAEVDDTVTEALLQMSQTNREFLAHASFIDDGQSWQQVCSIWDSASNTCLIRPHLVASHWEWATQVKRVVTGVGGKRTECSGIVIVPIKCTYNSEVQLVHASVIDFHLSIDFMYGLDYQNTHASIFDPAKYRVYVGSNRETIRLDHLSKVRSRMSSEPIGMVSVCGGCDPVLGMALMMGFRVAKYLSIEKYEHTRAVAKGSSPSIEHVEPHDLLSIDIKEFAKQVADLRLKIVLTSGCPCTPWSRLSENPLGFRHPLAELVRRTAELIAELDRLEVLWKVLNETVVPHEQLAHDVTELETIMGIKYYAHNAIESGAVASRPRLLGLRGASVQEMPAAKHINPSLVLDEGWNFTKIPVPCLVAVGDNTRTPTVVINGRGHTRFVNADERDRINPGARAGLSTGYGLVNLSERQRQRITGNAFSNDMLWAVMFQWTLEPSGLQNSMLSDVTISYAHMTAEEAELRLSTLTVPEMFAKFSSMVEPDFMPRIPIFVKEGYDVIPYQTRAPGSVPPKLQISADYRVEQMIRAGTHKRIPYSKDIWIMLMFFKPKLRTEIAEFDGPHWKAGDEMHSLRPLVDYRPSNSAQYYPTWLVEWSPNNRLNIATVPPGTTHWCDHDSTDAFHAMLLMAAGKRMSCSKYRDASGNDVYLEPQCCSQGQASSAVWFPPWTRYGYTCFIGTHHEKWWMDFSDDSCAHGTDEQQCLLRYSILGTIKVLMGMKPQLKRSPSCTTEKHWAGLVWTVRGICISETARQAIIEACSITPRGITQMRRLRGQIQSGLLGFDMSTSALPEFVRLMVPINDAITQAEATGKFAWPPEARQSQETIIQRMNNTPKAYTHPDRVLDDDHSLLALGDGDPRAVCSGLISVPVANASDITLDMIHDPGSGAVLVAVYFQTLNKHQQRWMMYEIETFSHVVCHRASCKFVNECMAKFTYHKDSPVVPKLKYGCDNTTALGNIASFTIPDGKIEHLMAKYQRFCGWCEEFAVTCYWPVCFMSVLGDHNSMFDTLVRLTASLRLRIPGIGEDPEEVDALPITLICQHETPADSLALLCDEETDEPHSVTLDTLLGSDSEQLPLDSPGATAEADEMAHAPTIAAGDTGHSLKTLPAGYAIHYLGLNQAQWSCLIMTYNEDDTSSYAGVKIKDIYNAMISGSADCSPNDLATIRSWTDRLFFLVDVGVPGTPALFTPSSQARSVDNDSPTDATKLLVPVIPDHTKVRLSTRPLSSTPYDDSVETWSQAFLRQDILWIVHYRPTPHAGKVKTIANAMRQAWWPGIEHDAEMTCRYCSVCCQALSVERSIGVGIQACRRLRWLVIDDKLLPPPIKAVTSYLAVLGMVDPAAGAIRFALRKGMTAMEAAVLIFCRWITQYGVPEKISSDNHGAFTAEVARLICNILGVESRVFSAVYNSRSQAHIENRNRIISEVLAGAVSKGDVTNDTDLELYIAEAEIRAFQLVETDGSTAFERCIGEPPRTVNSSLSAPGMEQEELEACLERLNDLDRDLAKSVYRRCGSLMEYKAVQVDKRARYNRAHLLAKEAQKKTTKHSYQVGSLVSLGGRKVTLDSLEPPDSDDPTTCWVSDRNGKSLHVRVDSLRPLSANIDEKLMPKDHTALELDDFIIYDAAAGLSGGQVTSVDDASCEVHDYLPVRCKTCVTWAPLWKDDGCEDRDPIRAVKCPQGFTPEIVKVDRSSVIAVVILKGLRLSDDSVARLKAMGHGNFDVMG